MIFFKIYIILFLFLNIKILYAHVNDIDIISHGRLSEDFFNQIDIKEFSKEKNFDLKPGILYYNVENIIKVYQLKPDWRIQQQQVILKNSYIFLKIQLNNAFVILNSNKYYLQKPFCFFNGEYLVSKTVLLMLDDIYGRKVSGLLKQQPVKFEQKSNDIYPVVKIEQKTGKIHDK